LNSSVSVTSVSAELIQNFQPTSEAELFRMIPGIQTNGTVGPGGNSNLAVRGLPVATGGSPFVQLQEDGLPTVLFGDIQFGNNDYWTHFDSSVARVEAVRGGSSSTFASQAPGAVINYISNYGEQDGGDLKLSSGLGFDDKRIDFHYGGAAGDTTRYHVGGYVHHGRGPLDAGYDTSKSFQVKANVTRELAEGNGYLRLLVKVANTQEPFWTGAPALANVSGNKISGVKSYPGFDALSQSNFSALNQDFLIINRDGDLQRVPMDGITTKALALGNQFHYEISDRVKVDNNLRWTKMSGGFAEPFLGASRTSGVIGSTVNGAVVDDVVYANGANAGSSYTGTYLNTNTNVRTNIRDIGSLANDLALSSRFDAGSGSLTARAGVFYMNQKIAMDWHTNRTYSELSGDNPAMLNLVDDAGNQLTANGIAGFNNNWGNCCARDYDLSYTDTAPYVNLDFDAGRWDLDGSVRFESMRASGWAHAGGAEFPTAVNTTDRDGNAVTVLIPTIISDGASENLDYKRTYTAYSVGTLFKATDNLSVFARTSKGGRFNSDRQTLSGKISADGSLSTAGETAAVDFVKQHELGVKARGVLGTGRYTLEATLLRGNFKQSNYEPTITPQCPAGGCIIDSKYRSSGLELYGTYQVGGFSLVTNATFTDAKRKLAGSTGGFVRAPDLPDLYYTVSAAYDFVAAFTAGVNVTGQSNAINGGGTGVPAGNTFGGFLKYRPIERLELGVQAYNLFDQFDLRGGGGIQDSSVSPGLIGVGSAPGFNLRGTIKLSF
jgi:outer membrane receptor protein involved in Fe transport